jgi:hypothetical protein
MTSVAHRLGLHFESILTAPSFGGVPIDSNSSFDSRLGLDHAVLKRGHEHLSADEYRVAQRTLAPLYEEAVGLAD